MLKIIKIVFICSSLMLLLSSCATTNKYPTYQDAVANWTSYKDVSSWLDRRFSYSYKRTRKSAYAGVVRSPERLYLDPKGNCTDAAYFAKETLNKINPDYGARLIYMVNNGGVNNHWVTGLYINNDLFVMDYGTGSDWVEMQGIHGPYKSLNEYHSYLSSLQIRGFRVGSVSWNDSLHLSED